MRKRLVTLLSAWLLATITFNIYAEISLTDDFGHTVILPQPAQRIISLAPHITESLFAIGAGDQVVATVSFSDYPEAAKTIPRIGSFNKINRESLVLMNPDLVLGWASGNGQDIIQGLEDLGLNIYVTEPRKLDDITDTLRDFATLTGQTHSGNKAADNFHSKLQTLRNTYTNKPPVSVFYQVWNQPLLTLNDKHLISAVIRLCGGTNVFGGALPLVPPISTESVLLADPEVIIASGMGQARPEWVDDWRQWPSLQAVQTNQLYFIPPSLLQRHSVRIAEGAVQMCRFIDMARTVTTSLN